MGGEKSLERDKSTGYGKENKIGQKMKNMNENS